MKLMSLHYTNFIPELQSPVCPNSLYFDVGAFYTDITWELPPQPFILYQVEPSVVNGTTVSVPSVNNITLFVTDHPNYNCSFSIETSGKSKCLHLSSSLISRLTRSQRCFLIATCLTKESQVSHSQRVNMHNTAFISKVYGPDPV